MKNLTSILVLCGLGLSMMACQQAEPQIDRADVARIITTLSADEMEGRRTFTPGIEKASRFIQQEFEKIGLERLEGLARIIHECRVDAEIGDSVK